MREPFFKSADEKKEAASRRSSISPDKPLGESAKQMALLRGILGSLWQEGRRPSIYSLSQKLSTMQRADREATLLSLQRTYGNRYVQNAVLQAKLHIDAQGDDLEQEADRLAEEMTSRTAGGAPSRVYATRAPGQRSGSGTIPVLSSEEVDHLRGSGQSLPWPIRAQMEPRLGQDLGRVRIHTGGRASELADRVKAHAFTSGQDIAFGPGKYQPSTRSGMMLLVHELVHVVHQDASIARGKIPSSHDAGKDRFNVQRKKKAQGDPAKTAAKEEELAGRIMADVSTAGGITVAVYPAVAVKSSAEFKRQAVQFASDHHALAISGGTVQEGKAMELNSSLPSVLRSLSQGINDILLSHPDISGPASASVSVKTLAIFTHGEKNQLQAGAHGNWIKNSLKPWVEAVAPFLSPSPEVVLYACLTAGTPPQGMSFAEALRELLQTELEKVHGTGAGVSPEVWGHTTAGHTTANINLVRFSGGEVSGDNLLGTLGEKMALLAADNAGRAGLTDDQRLNLKRRGRAAMARILAATTGTKDPTNTYVREIPLMGIDRVWRDLTTQTAPDLSNLGVIPDALERVKRGLEIFRKRFMRELKVLENYAGKL